MYRSFRAFLALTTIVAMMLALAAAASAQPLIGEGDDPDGDNWDSAIELELGSDKANIKSQPESFAIRPVTPLYEAPYSKQWPDTCRDGVDNDLDGQTDEGNDTGCTPPSAITGAFGPAAKTPVTVRLITKALLVDAGPVGKCASDFDGTGFAVIENGNPDGTNPDQQDISVAAAQLQGYSEIVDDNPGLPDNPAAGNQSGPAGFEPTECSLKERGEYAPPLDGGFPSQVDIIQDPALPSTGSVDDNNADPGLDFPATTTLNLKTITYNAVGRIPVGGAPLVQTNVTQLPSYCFSGCGLRASDLPFPGTPECGIGTDDKGVLCILPPQGPPPTPAVDHFKLYKTKNPKFVKGTVTVEDEFDTAGPEVTTLNKQTTLGNPADKNGEGINNNDNHLRCYQTKAPKFSKTTVVSHDQFGYQKLQITKPAELCMSSQKLPHPIPAGEDNFQCYKSTTKTKLGIATVSLADQFGSQTGVKVTLKPLQWCAPAAINGAGIPDTQSHLSCYKISGGTPGIPPVTGLTINPVNPATPLVTETGVVALKGTTLCTPSVRMS